MSDKLGKVYLTGAGCGGAELLTLRARELISACECLVYDDLIDEGILALAPQEAELVHVGKRAGRHSMSGASPIAFLRTSSLTGAGS